jgi:hypothetical protein
MVKQERRAYLDAIRARYRCVGKAGKSAIPNEFCAVCGYHRKYALRLLGARHERGNQVASKPDPAQARAGRSVAHDLDGIRPVVPQMAQGGIAVMIATLRGELPPAVGRHARHAGHHLGGNH